MNPPKVQSVYTGARALLLDAQQVGCDSPVGM